MRIIDADVLMELKWETYTSVGYVEVVAIDDIENVPTIEAEPVRHGHWEFYPDDNHLRCSVCRLEFLREKMPATRKYCPNCGAKMDLKE